MSLPIKLSEDLIAQLGDIQAESSIDSTNQYLCERALSLPNLSVCIAREQTNGRGSRGKSWQSPLGSGFYGSLLWKPQESLSHYPPISIMSAIALGETYNAIRPGKRYSIKWPNDLITPAGKLAGILVEVLRHANGTCSVVIGMGLNLLPPVLTKDAAEKLHYPIAGLYDHAELPSDQLRTTVFWQVAEAWFTRLLRYLQASVALVDMQRAWERHDAFLGQSVVLQAPNGEVLHAIGRGIAADGVMVVEHNGKRRVLQSGDWSIDWQRSTVDWRLSVVE